MLSHPLTNFEIQKYYKNEPKFNGVYPRNNLSKIKDESYAMNLDEFNSIETHWITLYVNVNNIIYFSSFEIEYIPKEIKKFIEKKNIITNIYRIQAYGSVMCEYFWIGFVDFMLKGKGLLDYKNLCSPSKLEKNDKIILEYFP